jgi:hypothetical protein
MKELDITNVTLPIALTKREAEEVAGGRFMVVGCPGCTSGGYLNKAFAIAQVINPALAETVKAVAVGE